MPYPANPCRHLFTNGHQCGSPALRGEPFCFYHHTARKPMPKRTQPGHVLSDPQLPAPDDFLAIQRGVGEVLRLLVNDALTDRRAQTLLRGLAVASQNLARHHHLEEKLAAQPNTPATSQPVTDFVNHPIHGTLAVDPAAPIEERSTGDGQTVPSPIPVLTPDPSPDTSYDQAKFVQLHAHFTELFRDKLQRFEHEKSLQLEALYEDRHIRRQTGVEARLAMQVQTSVQQNQDFRTLDEKCLALAS